MNYAIYETQYNTTTLLNTFNNEADARNFYNDRITAFIEGNDDEELFIDEETNDFYAEYEDGDTYSLSFVSYDRNYPFNKKTFNAVINDCKSYIDSTDDDEEQIQHYNEELNFAKAMSNITQKWCSLINTDIFHDAIGKVAYNNTISVGVWEEY